MSENVVYVKTPGNDEGESESVEEDIWDDTALIKAYDKAILMAKEKISKSVTATNGTKVEQEPSKTDGKKAPLKEIHQNNVSKKKSSKREKRRKSTSWRVGMHCRSTYSEDGLEYEAVIISLGMSSEKCIVKYVGYGNEEEVPINTLKPSRGSEARITQQIQAGNATPIHEEGSVIFHHQQGESMGMIPPPPPPFVIANLPKDETDALSAMLMSWYMSGYHTGYYQGLTRSKTMGNYSFK